MSQIDDPRSRYKDTPTLTGSEGLQFGLFEPPREIETPGTFGVYRVTNEDVGFPDRIAVSVYGQGNEDLWWAVAWASGMIDPDAEMFVGQVLYYPSRDSVLRFVGRAGEAA